MSDTKTKPTLVPTDAPRGAITHPWAALRGEMDRLFEDFASFFGFPVLGRGAWAMPAFANAFAAMPVKTPVVDVTETDKAFTIAAELPGLTESDVQLSLSGDLLALKAEKKQEADRDEANVHVAERSYGSYQRSFQVPPGVDIAKIEASFINGVLNITLPKNEAARAETRAIPVKQAA